MTDSAITHAGRTIRVTTPSSWVALRSQAETTSSHAAPPTDFSASNTPGMTTGSIDLILADTASSIPGWADTLVVTVEDISAHLSEEEWQAEVTRRSLQEIPGFHIIDIAQWSALSDSTIMRTGLYILDDLSLTTLQWSWLIRIGETREGVTMTFTCRTQDLESRLESFTQIVDSVEVA